MERTAPAAALRLSFEFARLGERCVGGDGDVGVEDRIESLDAAEAGLS